MRTVRAAKAVVGVVAVAKAVVDRSGAANAVKAGDLRGEIEAIAVTVEIAATADDSKVRRKSISRS